MNFDLVYECLSFKAQHIHNNFSIVVLHIKHVPESVSTVSVVPRCPSNAKNGYQLPNKKAVMNLDGSKHAQVLTSLSITVF